VRNRQSHASGFRFFPFCAKFEFGFEVIGSILQKMLLMKTVIAVFVTIYLFVNNGKTFVIGQSEGSSESTESSTGFVEEFPIYGPNDVHQTAMNEFMAIRRKDPTANLSTDGEFMKKANEYAIKRGRRRPEEELTLRVCYFFSFCAFLPFMFTLVFSQR
jgi:hypothetical protein